MAVTLLGKPLADYRVEAAQDVFDLKLDALRMTEALCARYGISMQGESKISLCVCDQMEGNAYCVKAQDGQLSVTGGHFTSVHAVILRLLALWQDRSEGELFTEGDAFCGKTDIPLTWQDDGTAAELMGQESKKPSYRLVWNDEFDGNSLEFEKWSGCYNMGMANTEQTVDERAIRVKDGTLTMITDVVDREKRTYTTSMSVSTHDTMNWSGGYLEMRAKVPMHALGEWPSYWAISIDSELFYADYKAKHNGEIPDNGYTVEVDMFEVFSSKDTVVPNLHKMFVLGHHGQGIAKGRYFDKEGNGVPPRVQLSGIDASASKSGTRTYKFLPKDGKTAEEIANDWHTYGFLWNRDFMAFSVDGDFYYAYSMKSPDHSDHFNPTYYDQDGNPRIFDMDGYSYEKMALSLILNNMFFSDGLTDKNFGYNMRVRPENDDKFFPLLYEVDYMRLYQTDGDKLYLPDHVGDGKSFYPLTYFGH